jgi:2-C-methyl-D-erythritol 4-phosphate cytidylyltransferase
MKNAVIIVAGGTGSRMGTPVPKQFLEIAGKPVILHTIEKFLAFDPDIEMILVINPAYRPVWDQLILNFRLPAAFKIAEGGETRFHSVKNGIMLLKESSLVGIHDAVRPMISVETIKKIYKHAAIHGNAIPAVPVRESVREVWDSGSKMIDRSVLKYIQTPQVFLYSLLKKAYETDFLPEFTDDASVVEKSGIQIHLVDGDPCNIKITTPEDIEIAKSFLRG